MGQIGQLTTAATAAGRLVLAALEDQHPARSLSRLSDSPRAIRLLRELFIVAVRRSFAGREPRDITRYVDALLSSRSLPTGGEIARQTEALIRSALGEPELAHAVPDLRRFELICYVVGDLAGSDRGRSELARSYLARSGPTGMPGAAGGDPVALIDHAEKRVARFDRPRNRTIGRRSI